MVVANHQYMWVAGGAQPLAPELSEGAVMDVWRFEFERGVWVELETHPADPVAGLPPARACHAGALVGRSLYIFGGMAGSATVLDDAWRLDLHDNLFHRIRLGPQVVGGGDDPDRGSAAEATVSDEVAGEDQTTDENQVAGEDDPGDENGNGGPGDAGVTGCGLEGRYFHAMSATNTGRIVVFGGALDQFVK